MEVKTGISLEDYKRIRENVGWFQMKEEQMIKSLESSSYIISVVDNNKVVGMARCVSDDVYMAFIYDVSVCKEYQHQGIGKLIIENIIEYYKSISIPECPMQLCLLSVKGVEEFYKGQGFKIYPNMLNGSGMGQWINKKPY